MTIDTHGHDQQPLFPTSHEERTHLQESLLDLLSEIAARQDELKQDTARRRTEIAALQKKAAKIEELLRQSRPRPR